jgi:glycerol-3-phosphate dehydrogenase
VGGIRSTGLSAALGIASLVFRQYRQAGAAHKPVNLPEWPRVPAIAETGARDWQQADNDGIVCHCELVTRREIELALKSPIAPGSLAELKRRTRATMGRCQGFYCSAELSEITAGCFAQALGERIE